MEGTITDYTTPDGSILSAIEFDNNYDFCKNLVDILATYPTEKDIEYMIQELTELRIPKTTRIQLRRFIGKKIKFGCLD